jgi:hypothetical protein
MGRPLLCSTRFIPTFASHAELYGAEIETYRWYAAFPMSRWRAVRSKPIWIVTASSEKN